MDYETIFQGIWMNCVEEHVGVKTRKLLSLLLKRISLLSKQMGHVERKSEFQAFFLEDSLQWVENDIPNTMAPYYILTETGARLPGTDGTKDCIKNYYLNKAEQIGYYIQILKQLGITSKKAKNNRELLLQMDAMVTFVNEVYQSDLKELDTYLLCLTEFLQGKTKKVEKNIHVYNLADYLYGVLSSIGFDLDYSLLEEKYKR